jgi:hypothetical protein
METTMLNEKDVLSQARDKNRESVQWIVRETMLRQGFGIVELRKKGSREWFLGRAMKTVKSLILLKWPALGHR